MANYVYPKIGGTPGSGDVVGPGSSTNNAVVRFDGTTGALIQNSVVLIDDTGGMTGVTDLSASRVAFGNDAVIGLSGGDGQFWDFSQTVTDFTAATSWAILNSTVTFDPSVDLTGGNAKFLYGQQFDTNVKSGNSKNFEYVNGMTVGCGHYGTGVVSAQSGLYVNSYSYGSGDITDNIGEFIGAGHQGTGSIGHNICVYYRSGHSGTGGSITLDETLVIDTPSHDRPLTTHRGLQIEDQDFGTTSHAIHSEGGNVEFGARTGRSVSMFFTGADINQPVTTVALATTWGLISPLSATAGGMNITGLSDSNAIPFEIVGIFGSASPTITLGAVTIVGQKTDGGTGVAALAGTERVFDVKNNTTSLFSINGTGTTASAGALLIAGRVTFTGQDDPATNEYSLSKDTSSNFRFNTPTTRIYDFKIAGSSVYTLGGSANTFTQIAYSTAASSHFTFTGAAVTAGTASQEIIDFNLNYGRTIEHATGAITSQRCVSITPPTYSFVGASTISIGATVAINGLPTAGANATITNATGLLIGSTSGYTSNAATAVSLASFMPGITDGVGATSKLAGLSFLATGSVTLGNQTATTSDVALLDLAAITYVSTTNTRTVTRLSTLYIAGAPTASTNVTATNGPYAIFVDAGTCRFDGNVLIGTSVAGSSAAAVLALSNSATDPTTSVDLTQIYSKDISAGNATLAIFTETSVAVDAALVSTHSLVGFFNLAGTMTKFKIPLIAA